MPDKRDYDDEELRAARAANIELTQVVDRYRAALARIAGSEGKVCAEFTECTHRACASSYAAFAIADAALHGYDSPESAPPLIPGDDDA